MLHILLEKMAKAGYTVTFERGHAAESTKVTASWGGGQYDEPEKESAENRSCFAALYDVLVAAGDEELLKQAAADLAKKGKGKAGKRANTSAQNGRKGGRPEGSKDSQPRIRSVQKR
jgi:hypothetical protein